MLIKIIWYNDAMFAILLRKLTVWRNEAARREGVELFRVLPNKTLEEVARREPKNKAELTAIKGVKEAKFQKYGREILSITKGDAPTHQVARSNDNDLNYFKNAGKEVFEDKTDEAAGEKIFSVGEFLDALNGKLTEFGGRVKGEISSIDERERAVYFSIKDKSDESVMNCFVFRYQYDILGVKLEEGMVIVVAGYPEIYKPYGRLSLRVSSIELEGEGALKKEYEALKKKLEEEGIFAESAKRKFVALPRKIGLVTSREGAAIGDFIGNVGQFGLSVKFMNSSVEGRRAVFELINAVRVFQKSDIDVLVIIRGGGSLESLQAFNNEALIREAKKMKVPVVCGVGHDRDISLLSLTADYSVSTPTAAARLIGELWEKEVNKIDYFEKNILESFEAQTEKFERDIKNFSFKIDAGFRGILRREESRYESFLRKVFGIIEENLSFKMRELESSEKKIGYGFAAAFARTENRIDGIESVIKLNDPSRQLRLGYGIISKNGSSIRSVREMNKGDMVKIRVWDGEAQSEIKKIKKIQ